MALEDSEIQFYGTFCPFLKTKSISNLFFLMHFLLCSMEKNQEEEITGLERQSMRK